MRRNRGAGGGWKLAVGAGLVVAALVGAALWAWMWTSGYLRGEDFRKLVAGHLGNALMAEVRMAPLEWDGPVVYCPSLDASGLDGSTVREGSAEQVRARVDWHAVVRGTLRVESVSAAGVKVVLGPGAGRPRAGATPAGGRGPVSRVEVGPIEIGAADIGWQNAGGSVEAELKGSSLGVEPDGSSWKFSGSGGEFALGEFPAMAVESFRSRLSEGTFFLTDARLRVGATGKLALSGEFAGRSTIHYEFSGVDVVPLLPADWKGKLTGTLRGSGASEWGGNSPAKSHGAFSLGNGLIENVPLLDRIASFTDSPRFRHMPLHEISGQYTWAGGRWDITRIVAESKGLLRAEGALAVDAAGNLEGSFRLGVSPQVLQWLPGSRERVFTANAEGYDWTDVRIAGTLDHPKEDLSVRLALAAKDETIRRGAEILTLPPATIRDGAKTLFDALSPLIE